MMSDRIQICDLTIFNSRNIYSHRTVIKLVVDIGKYDDIPTKDIPGFNEQLLLLFPGLKSNYCGLGYEGGFLERLETGTYMAHVLEHVILEMQYMVGYDLHFGRTRRANGTKYNLIYEFENEVCGLECGKAAIFILNCLLDGEAVDVGEFIDYLKKVSQEAELGPSTSAIVAEAKKRGIPVTRIGSESLVRLGYGRHSRLLEATLTDVTSCISADISCNKQLTKFILNENQIPVPYGKVVYSEISAVMVANQIGKPVVIKPFDGNQGKGVHLNLVTDEEIKTAFTEASKYSNGIIVEKFVTGKDYRILVVGGRVCAAAERLPASVTGDGSHTVRELAEIVNQDPNRGEQHQKSLTKITVDDVAVSVLKQAGLTPDDIPQAGRVVTLRRNGNISTGGTANDVTDIIHPDNAEIAVRAANAIGIDIAGIDVVAEDITKPITGENGCVVEVNTAPGIRMHLYPSSGTPRNVAKDIADWLFPDEASVRFPIVSVTGTNGKTTVCRLIRHILALTGLQVGMTSTSGTFIGEKCVCKGDNSGPRSARSLLADKRIDAAVLETARGGIVREGLGYDLADVGIITNITEDHLGLNGIDTLEDLVYVKSLVVEAIREGGTAVLNAENPLTPQVLERVKAKVALFYRDEKAIEQYKTLDCVRIFTNDGRIRIEDGEMRVDVIDLNEVPITSDGRIVCNIENCLAAVSALYALRVPVETIRAGLKSFKGNAGRLNLFRLRDFEVMLDYGHNPAGYEAAIDACRNICGSQLSNRRLIGVIGMPGDRQDSAIRYVGKTCASAFSRLYIKEDHDLRGRNPGEVAKLLYDSAIETGFVPEDATIIEDEPEALKKAVENAQSGDLIVVFYEKLEPLKEFLLSSGAICSEDSIIVPRMQACIERR